MPRVVFGVVALLLAAACDSPARSGGEAETERPRGPSSIALEPGPTDAELARVPAIVITDTQVLLDGAPIAAAAEVEAMEGWLIPRLHEALKAEAVRFAAAPMPDEDRRKLDGTIVLRTSTRTPARLLNRVMKTCYASGYPNVMFDLRKP